MLGNKFDAKKTALEYRLINQICEREELLSLAVDSAEKLATAEGIINNHKVINEERTESITDKLSSKLSIS